jgi:hypothetical protein
MLTNTGMKLRAFSCALRHYYLHHRPVLPTHTNNIEKAKRIVVALLKTSVHTQQENAIHNRSIVSVALKEIM